MTEISIFIFRRDLRLQDNTSLIEICKKHTNVVPVFIFTPEQITKKNKFKSNNAIEFMVESLLELQNDLKNKGTNLLVFQDTNINALKRIQKNYNIKSVAFNQDYTPYAKKRDEEIKTWCDSNSIECIIQEDYLLMPVGSILKPDKTPYTIYTPFRNKGVPLPVNKPKTSLQTKNFASSSLIQNVKQSTKSKGFIKYSQNPNKLVKGGRIYALKKLQNIKSFKTYNNNRNTPSIPTTQLSAYIKFGNVSIREVYWKMRQTLGMNNQLIDQLFWREFYFYITHYFPKVLQGKPFNVRYKSEVKWRTSKKELDLWQEGKTGYPIVDAGMRQLNVSGFMHNRLRLITSNFLNRMLGLDWRHGELYYARQLTDYDPSVNNGNWQWTASVGVDPKPYYQRLFNPWLQSDKFDKKAEYIKQWIPELKEVPSEHIHKWDVYYKEYPNINYPPPMVDYKMARERSIKMFQETK